MRSMLLVLSSVLLVCSIYIGNYIFQNFEKMISSGPYILLSCLLSLSAVSFGWWVSLHISKRQSTLSIISQSRLSEFYMSQVKAFSTVFPRGEIFTVEQSKDPKNKEAMVGLNGVLNFFEFLSVGMKENDLSESVCKAFYVKIFANVYYRSSEYIHHCQVNDSLGLYENFVIYAKKWNPNLKK